MGLASCASKALPFSKATTIIRKPPSGPLLKMASTARAISCVLIPPPESIATLNVRPGEEEKHRMDYLQWTMDNRPWTIDNGQFLVLLEAKQGNLSAALGGRRSEKRTIDN